MKLLTPDARLRKGQKLKFVPHDGTNTDYVGLECTLTVDYNGEDNARIEVMSPYYHKLNPEICTVMPRGTPRLAIVGATGFGQWIKEHKL